MTLNLNEEAMIDTEWLSVKNYEFKILVMIACLAENHLAFRGKLKDMCDFLGVSNHASNVKKIKEAINTLEAKGDIKVLVEGYTWTLTLSTKAERKSKVINIKNAYIQAIKDYESTSTHNAASWESILKVLVYLCSDKREVIRYDEIKKALNLKSIDVVKNATNALMNIDFKDMSFKKRVAWLRLRNGDFKPVGNKYEVGLRFE